MISRIVATIACFCAVGIATAQYAPQAGIVGSDAIAAGSTLFQSWATGCSVYRGYMNIADTSLGLASAGDSSQALGPADDYTVSLGDSGVAVLSFAVPISNGTGPDFAVFENGFLDPTNDSLAFLELGFVEVSSDGVHYFRFPAASLTQDTVQANNDTYLYANQLHNLAGNYIAMTGTPFDLDELAGTEGLDINAITQVRIVDVIGSISGHSSHDSAGRVINDPYPTPYPSCGFDLDAVGVINQSGNAGINTVGTGLRAIVYPNPTDARLNVHMDGNAAAQAVLTDVTGRHVLAFAIVSGNESVNVSSLQPGFYNLVITTSTGDQWEQKIIKR